MFGLIEETGSFDGDPEREYEELRSILEAYRDDASEPQIDALSVFGEENEDDDDDDCARR